VLFETKREWQFHAADSKSKSKNSPFDGWSFPGRIRMTISEGKIVYEAPQRK